MNLKGFFKLTTTKIILTVVLLAISFFFVIRGGDITLFGFPVPYIETSDYVRIGSGSYLGLFLGGAGLLIDLIFWYLISCAVVALYHKIRKK